MSASYEQVGDINFPEGQERKPGPLAREKVEAARAVLEERTGFMDDQFVVTRAVIATYLKLAERGCLTVQLEEKADEANKLHAWGRQLTDDFQAQYDSLIAQLEQTREALGWYAAQPKPIGNLAREVLARLSPDAEFLA